MPTQGVTKSNSRSNNNTELSACSLDKESRRILGSESELIECEIVSSTTISRLSMILQSNRTLLPVNAWAVGCG